MNPQYMPQQFGAPPAQNYSPMKPTTGMTQPGQNNDHNQPPYGYKPPMAQMNNVPLNSPNQMPPNMPPMMNPSNIPGSMPPPGSYAPQRLNGPNSMAPPGQARPQRPMYAPTPMGAPPRPMGPGQPQICPMGPPASQLPPGQGPVNHSLPRPSMPPGQPSVTSMGQPPTSQIGPRSNQMSPTQMGTPSGPMGHPTGQMGPPSGQMGPSSGQMGPPSGQMGPPSGQMGPPSGQIGLPSGQMGPPSGQMGPPTGQMGPPSGQKGPPSGQMAPLNHMGPPSGQMPPTSQMAHPSMQMPPTINKIDNDKQNNAHPSPSRAINQHPEQNDLGQQPRQMPPNLSGPPSMNSQMGAPPIMNAPPMNNFGPPPKLPTNTEQFQPKSPQYPGMPPTGPPGPQRMGPPGPQPGMNQPGMPPMPMPGMNQPAPGQYGQQYPPMGPNQLSNQMSGMQIGGQRQYPGAKSPMNGENLPHMPPPINQDNYVNGQQMRSPQMPGYPPMPGQQQMPGQQMPGQQMPGQQMPGQQMPGQQMPGQQMPGQQMPGQQQMQGQMPGGPYPPQPNYQQPQQPRRLDPDQMPSPIQVTQDDQRTRSGIFCTNQKGLVPPLVSTQFITQDQGHTGPRFMRSTMYNVPTTSDMMKQTAVPFGLVISPMARTADQEYPPPIIDFGEHGPVRCIRCKAYMCPFMQFIDSGRRFQCLFCKATTEVPAEYFQHLDHTGLRVDRFERPELILGTYEFVATKDYCRNTTFPKPPAIIFIIDVSYNNVKSGLVHLLCAEMKNILKNLPIDQGQEKSQLKVGFITYNNTVHFYNIKGSLAQPQMMVVGDMQEMFMPLLDGFLCDIEESASVIDSLMEQIPNMFVDSRDTEIVLLPAIQAGLEALKASECAGKLMVFHSTLPTAEAPGKLKNRDDRKLLGTEKERTVLTPQTQAYNQLGMDCVGAGCSVDMFIFNNSYIDIATIGQVSRLTGGEVFKYTYFQADIDGQRLVQDIITDISRPIAFDSIMRVRTSTGIRPTDFYGHFYMSNTTDIELAAIDCDKAVAVEIKHDDKLTEEEGVYIQVALLYTSCGGQRRLRIMNLGLKTCSQMADLYRSCELDTLVNFFAKQSVYRLLENNPKQVKDSLVNRCAQILACYRKNCASPSSAGQLILPECMKLLPLYVNCLLKSDAISGGSDMTLDERSFAMQAVMIMDIPTSVVYFYPRLIPLHEIQVDNENNEIPNAVRTTVEKMTDNGIYLLENGIHMLMWIGSMANPEWVQSVFGVPMATQIDTERFELPELDNKLSILVRKLVNDIRVQRHRCMRLTLVKQRDKLELVFRHYLVEDRGNDGSTSYVDFLCHMHKEIRQLLS